MKAQRFKASLVTGHWPDNPEPLVRDNSGDYVKHSDLLEALRQRDEARKLAEDMRLTAEDCAAMPIVTSPFPWENDQEQESQ